MDTLLSEIEAFQAEHKLADTAFGDAALGDRHFLRQLREGREPRRATVARVRQWMADYQPAPAQAA